MFTNEISNRTLSDGQGNFQGQITKPEVMMMISSVRFRGILKETETSLSCGKTKIYKEKSRTGF